MKRFTGLININCQIPDQNAGGTPRGGRERWEEWGGIALHGSTTYLRAVDPRGGRKRWEEWGGIALHGADAGRARAWRCQLIHDLRHRQLSGTRSGVVCYCKHTNKIINIMINLTFKKKKSYGTNSYKLFLRKAPSDSLLLLWNCTVLRHKWRLILSVFISCNFRYIFRKEFSIHF